MARVDTEHTLIDVGLIGQTNRPLYFVDIFMGGVKAYLQSVSESHRGQRFRVLDIACGTQAVAAGEIAYRYSYQADVFALDLAKRWRSKLHNLHLIMGNAFELPIRDGSIDFAYTLGLTYWYRRVNDYKGITHLLEEIARVLAPGGIALVDYQYRDFRKHQHMEEMTLAQNAGVNVYRSQFGSPFWINVIKSLHYHEWPDHNIVMQKPLEQETILI